MFIPNKVLEEKLKQMLKEDVGQSDVTTAAIVPSGLAVEAAIIAKEGGVAAGIEEVAILAESLGLTVKTEVVDGKEVQKGQTIANIFGDAQTILSAERTILNLLSRMSGIATTTKRLVEKIKQVNSKAKIAATRKTAPGLLYFDKKAVLLGGGDPHRLHLDDLILIKNNHISIAGSVEKAVKKARKDAPFNRKIEAEVTSVAGASEAIKAGADIIMFDNFSPDQINDAVKTLKKFRLFGKVLLEVSGGITAKNLLEYASTQVDIISIGELTHSARALNISMEIIKIDRSHSKRRV